MYTHIYVFWKRHIIYDKSSTPDDIGLTESILRQLLKCFQRSGRGAVDRFRGSHTKNRGCFRTLEGTVISCRTQCLRATPIYTRSGFYCRAVKYENYDPSLSLLRASRNSKTCCFRALRLSSFSVFSMS